MSNECMSLPPIQPGDLISRSALLEQFSRFDYRLAISTISGEIQAAPAVDAVEVVRCKVCEYYEADECVNPYIFMSDGARLYTDDDDFCSYGERKDNG